MGQYGSILQKSKIMMIRYIKSIALLFVIIGMVSCSDNHEGDNGKHQTIRVKLDAVSVDSINYDISTKEFLKDMKKVLAEVPEEGLEFYVPQRSNVIKSFPCSNCHTMSLGELQKTSDEDMKKAHWNIKMSHANTEVLNCTTCHNENKMDELNSVTGKAISIDHSYQLCAQCHSTQYKEWEGGAHGKRLGGWVPPRVINSCVNCHNPHSPAFESKWPARLNTVKLKEQSSD